MKKIGLVGLPNSGKSSFFRLLTKRKDTLIANYCFSTMDRETENFKFWDERVCKIASFFKSPKLTFSSLKISDVPGIVRDAHKNKGLGSRFISHIRECDLIILLVRIFEDETITHFEGRVDPLRDFDLLISELILSDIEQIGKALEKTEGENKEKSLLLKLREELNSFNRISQITSLTEEEEKLIKNYNFLTKKPMVVVANLGGNEVKQARDLNFFSERIKNYQIVGINVKEEIDKGDEGCFKNEKFSNLLKSSLKMKNFFTAGEKEVKS